MSYELRPQPDAVAWRSLPFHEESEAMQRDLLHMSPNYPHPELAERLHSLLLG